MKNLKKKIPVIPVIAVIAAVCVTGLTAASASSFADTVGEKNTKDVSNKTSDKIATTNQYIGEDAAKKIAIAKVSGAAIENITEFYLEHDGGKAEYDGKIYFENVKYEFEINAVDGTITEWEQENKKTTTHGAIDATSSATGKGGTTSVNPDDKVSTDTSTYIGIEKAKEILLLRVPGATIAKIDLEYDDGKVKYEGKMYLNNLEYEFEMNAVTGEIVDLESDSNDNSDCDDEDDNAKDTKDVNHVSDDSEDDDEGSDD